MKAITGEWLERAKDDLYAAEILLQHPELTNMVAFHAQQVVEKSLKAILEEADMNVWDFQLLLGSRKIPVHYDVQDYLEDQTAIEALSKS